jgi:hypothetical protein
MNPEQSKYFEDVDVESMGFGGLGGSAVENHHKAKAKPTRDGVKIALDCGTCGSPNIMTVDWQEAVVISQGAIPPNWVYEQGYIRPEVGCAQCRRLVSPGVTPDEAKRWVTAAVNARFIAPQQVQQIIARIPKRG